MDNAEVLKYLDLTTNIVIACIQSGKFEAKDGEAAAAFFDKVYGQVCDCANLTSPAFIKNYTKQREQAVRNI